MAATAMKARRPRRKATTRSRSPRPTPSKAASPKVTLLDRIEGLVRDNASLRAENDRLNALVGRIEGALGSDAPGRRRRGRPAGRPNLGPQPGSATASRPPTRKPRRPITDPVLLEKRRAALAKARKALATKRSAARAG
jgi:hypothetical protein